MAQQPMSQANPGDVALSSEYNKVLANVRDLDARVTTATNTNAAQDTKNTQQDSLLTNHTGRLDADHNRLTTLENRTTNTTTGNAALGDRVTDLESRPVGGGEGGGVTGTGYVSLYVPEESNQQSFSTGTLLASSARIEWRAREREPVGAAVTDNNRTITINYAGLWIVSVFARLTGNFSANRLMIWLGPPNSSDDRYGFGMIQPTTALQDPGTSFTIQKRFTAGQQFSVWLFQESGSNKTVFARYGSTALTATLLSA